MTVLTQEPKEKHEAESDIGDSVIADDKEQHQNHLTIDTVAANRLDQQEDASQNVDSTEEKKSPLPVAVARSPIEFKHPPSPQPWDLVDPPPTNNNPPAPAVGNTAYSNVVGSQHQHPLIPKSSYYFGPPPPGSAYGTPPVGRIGIHHPREIIRVERDYSGGELIQFAAIYPLELEGRITPTQFLESINSINELLISAHSATYACIDNFITIFTLQLSRLVWTSHYQKEMKRLRALIDSLNKSLYNPVGLNILWPRSVAFLFLEIEYY